MYGLGESEDEQKPDIFSAHPPQHIRQQLLCTKTELPQSPKMLHHSRSTALLRPNKAHVDTSSKLSKIYGPNGTRIPT